MAKVLGYARVSSGQGQDVSTQKEALYKLGAVWPAAGFSDTQLS